MKRKFSLCLLVLAFTFSLPSTQAARSDQAQVNIDETQPNANAVSLATQTNPMTLVLDARQAARGIMFAHLTIPVRSGPFTLVYPKWIPGEHGPTGPLSNMAMLQISASGTTLPWRRDLVNLYAFHLDVPPGVSSINVDMDVLVNSSEDKRSTANLAIVNWNRDLLYQNDTSSQDVFVKPSILLPAGWDSGTALPDPKRSGGRVDFNEVNLTTLVDSPLDCGKYYKHVKLWAGSGATAQLDVFADRPQDLEFPVKVINEYKRVVPEALALYGARHWQDYHFLLTLTEVIGTEGIEHLQSSDNREPGDFFVNPDRQLGGGDLLTHELSHSWNGKYRRPEDLTTPNFQIPMKTDLLWVYEGLNEYLGHLLSYRAGIRERKLYPEQVASIYAELDSEPGRERDPLIDTAAAAPYLFSASGDYASLRRSTDDFYTEGHLLWLDVDTIIRERTSGRKSLDDFLHLFAGPPNIGPATKTYTREELEQLLNALVAADWHAYFQQHVYEISLHPPTDEIERSGWKLIYTDAPNTFDETEDELRHRINLWYSLGTKITDEGDVLDVRQNSPAWQAGLTPNMNVIAVDRQSFSKEVLTYAIKSAEHSTAPITLLVKQDGWYQTRQLAFHRGLRYPHLVRMSTKPDMLAKITEAHAH